MPDPLNVYTNDLPFSNGKHVSFAVTLAALRLAGDCGSPMDNSLPP